MGKRYCDCGKPAKWVYMPGFLDSDNDFSCDDCVSRGCSCNNYHLMNDYENAPTEEDGVEGKDWKWLEKDVEWTPLDNKGREYPCVEFGYDTDEDNFSDL
jgi:hypothetical protein